MGNRIEAVFEAAFAKFSQGELKHGPFDPGTDQRDFLQEAENEILDAINYLAMFLVKIRALKNEK